MMIPTNMETSLRRSGVGLFRKVQLPALNDDEEERRQRRTAAYEDSATSSSADDSETLKNCLKICHENKLSKENAWSISVIDTLTKLIDKHQYVLNNFKVAGTSLEASTKVYGLRVDSIHIDVVRLTAGLNKKKANSKNDDDNENQDDNEKGNEGQIQEKAKYRRKRRKHVSTVTKNKETINGKLDTHPFTDPIFAKLNAMGGNINSSSRLLQNILPSVDSEIMLRTNYNFWDPSPSQNLSFSDEYNYTDCQKLKNVEICSMVESLTLDKRNLRPIQTGYIIDDTPVGLEGCNYDKESNEDYNHADEREKSHLAMAFDINAEVEPMLTSHPQFMDVDMEELNELTNDEQAVITNCRKLRKPAIIIEDMRPLDSASANLEYSYRPMAKISQYWAGPSHWKFKRTRNSCLTLAQRLSSKFYSKTIQKQKSRTKKYSQIHFTGESSNKFRKLTESVERKLKKVNVIKSWDAKKIKLPTDLKFDQNIFDRSKYYLGKKIVENIDESISPELPMLPQYNYQNPIDHDYCSNVRDDDDVDAEQDVIDNEPLVNTVVEIGANFEGAPEKVTRIVVPFAKRAKVVDMKQLKKCCFNIIQKEFSITNKENVPEEIRNNKNEKYKDGEASFTKIYKELPNSLTSSMAEALSPSIAFYSILHLANENNLRLIQQNDLKDFKIVQLDN